MLNLASLSILSLSFYLSYFVGHVFGSQWNSREITQSYYFVTVVKAIPELNVSKKWTSVSEVKIIISISYKHFFLS